MRRMSMALAWLALGSPYAARAGEEDDSRHELASNRMIAVTVERAIYEDRKGRRFFMRVVIRNKLKTPIAVDLRSYHGVISPNQWTATNLRERAIIDERRSVPKKLTPKLREEVLAAFRKQQLTRIPAGKSLSYFRDFNGNAGKAAIRARKRKHLIISMDGQIIATDGKSVTAVDCQWSNDRDATQTDVVVAFPLTWRMLPKKALVVRDK